MLPQFSMWKKRALHLKALPYQLVHRILYTKHNNGIFLRCLEAQDSERVLHDMHDILVRDHFAGNTTAHKVMRDNFYWPTLFKDAHVYVRKCPVYQRCTEKT